MNMRAQPSCHRRAGSYILRLLLVLLLISTTNAEVVLENGQSVSLYTFKFITGATRRSNSIDSRVSEGLVVELTYVHPDFQKAAKRQSMSNVDVGAQLTLRQLGKIDMPVRSVNSTVTTSSVTHSTTETGRSQSEINHTGDRQFSGNLTSAFKLSKRSGQGVVFSRTSWIASTYANVRRYVTGLWHKTMDRLVVLLKKCSYAAYDKSSQIVASTIASTVDFAAKIASIWTMSHKSGCGGQSLKYNKDGTEWIILMSTYTTGENCDATASTKYITAAFKQCIEVATTEGAVGYSCKFSHKGTWYADFRVCAKGAHCNWDFPCAD